MEQKTELGEYIQHLFNKANKSDYPLMDDEAAEIREKAIKKTLETYDPQKGARIETHCWKIAENLLIDRQRRIEKQELDGKQIKAFGEIADKIMADYRADVEEALAGFIVEPLKEQEAKFIHLFYAAHPDTLTNKAAAEGIGCSVETVKRIKRRLREKIPKFSRPETGSPGKYNEAGAKDLTPHNAGRRTLDPNADIKYK